MSSESDSDYEINELMLLYNLSKRKKTIWQSDYLKKHSTNGECKKWVQVTGKEDLAYIPIEKLNQLKFVCGKHFAKKDFTKVGARLKRSAVPSLELTAEPLPDHVLTHFPYHINKDRLPPENAEEDAVPANPLDDHNYSQSLAKDVSDDCNAEDDNNGDDDEGDVTANALPPSPPAVSPDPLKMEPQIPKDNIIKVEAKGVPVQISETCRVCCSMVAKEMETDLWQHFTNVTGIEDSCERLPRGLCCMCARKLHNAVNFTKLATQTDKFLKTVVTKGGMITTTLMDTLHSNIHKCTRSNIYVVRVGETPGTENIEDEQVIKDHELIPKEEAEEEISYDSLQTEEVSDILNTNIIEGVRIVSDRRILESIEDQNYDVELEQLCEDELMPDFKKMDEQCGDSVWGGDDVSDITDFDDLDNQHKPTRTEANLPPERTEANLEPERTKANVERERTDDNLERERTEANVEQTRTEGINKKINEEANLTYLLDFTHLVDGKLNAFSVKALKSYKVLLKNGFTILKLNKEEQERNLEIMKRSNLNVKRDFICDHCWMSFSTKVEIERHLKKHIERPRKGGQRSRRFCSLCQLELPSLPAWMSHAERHSTLFLCGQCPHFSSNCRQSSLQHMLTHKAETEMVSCHVCYKGFSKNGLATHIRFQHPEAWRRRGKTIMGRTKVVVYKCQRCKLQFYRPENLTKHIAEQHPKRRTKVRQKPDTSEGTTTVCDDCGKVFQDSKKLRQHKLKHTLPLRNKNRTTRIVLCEKCGMEHPPRQRACRPRKLTDGSAEVTIKKRHGRPLDENASKRLKSATISKKLKKHGGRYELDKEADSSVTVQTSEMQHARLILREESEGVKYLLTEGGIEVYYGVEE